MNEHGGFLFFHTARFLYFLAIVLAVYWALPKHRWRMAWLLAASCYFYMSWNWKLISLIFFSAGLDYLIAQKLEATTNPRSRKTLMILSVSANLALLAFFKYANFFLDSSRTALGWFGVDSSPILLDIVLPLGISFYTFETISYIVDVYLGRCRAERNFLDYSLFIMFFPHLIAGPIVRPRDFLPQIAKPKRWSWDRAQFGIQFILIGLFKKAVIADHLAVVVDPVFKSPNEFSSAATWLAVLSYAIQIYCDFSGYTDMAIGVANLFGFRLRKNFDMPYFAASVTEFWRRWHISLSSWLRDYLYIPMGGSRGGEWKTYRNLFLTMLLGGFWHGASWTFVAWGALHGGLLVLERAVPIHRAFSRGWLRPIGVACTFLLICIGWVFFRAQNFEDARRILKHMFVPHDGGALDAFSVGMAWSLLLATLTFHLVRRFVNLKSLERSLPAPILGASFAFMLTTALVLMPKARAAFIYFQF